MVDAGPSHFGLGPDAGMILGFLAVLLFLASRLYPGLAR